MNYKTWLKGLLAAIIGGAANTVTAAFVDPQHFNLSHDGLIGLGKFAAAGAIISFFLYLKQSPIPNGTLPPK